MCEFCTKHGEGKKWYLNTKNYSYDLLNDIKRRKLTEDFFFWIDNGYKKYFHLVKSLPLNLPVIGPSIKAMIRKVFIGQHWGQIVPIEDVEKILHFTNSITRAPCVCRMTTTGKEHRVCFLISLDPSKMDVANIVDKSYFGGPDLSKFEKVDKEWTINFMKERERMGMLHSIWTLKAPFIGSICNCDLSSGCIWMKMLKEVTSLVFRSEYVAVLDNDKCIGCKSCLKVCQFDAIKFDIQNKKAEIDPKKCYGCGICRSVCKTNAVRLIDRKESLEASKYWI